MTRDFGRQVWAPDSREGYVLGTLDDIGSENITVVRKDGKGQVSVWPDNFELYAANVTPQGRVKTDS